MWSTWLALMTENAGGLDRPDFAYLRDRFETFQDFASVVSFLQSSAIEGGSNKRWSSKFVFPFGTSALYEDVSVTATGVATDRRFFARTGEILYLMLCRSQRAAELRERLARRILNVDAPYDGLITRVARRCSTCEAGAGRRLSALRVPPDVRPTCGGLDCNPRSANPGLRCDSSYRHDDGTASYPLPAPTRVGGAGAGRAHHHGLRDRVAEALGRSRLVCGLLPGQQRAAAAGARTIHSRRCRYAGLACGLAVRRTRPERSRAAVQDLRLAGPRRRRRGARTTAGIAGEAGGPSDRAAQAACG